MMDQDKAESDVQYVCREARPEDCGGIINLIKELAEYEKLTEQMILSKEQLLEDGFGSQPFYGCIVAENIIGDKSDLIGYCLFYYTYSTFQGRSIYLEDIYTSPNFRCQGLASKMLKKLAQVALEKRCVRLDFIALNWNEPSLAFYRKRGAVDLTTKEKWHLLRIEKDDLLKLAL